jgi:multidrug efflux pump subunit AcrA (membrane-fusion protein)
MDVVKKKKESNKNKFIVGSVVLVLIACALKYFASAGSSFSVDRNRLSIAQVKQGKFDIKVSALGTLVSENAQWVTSTVDGVVTKILVRPGEKVVDGQPLIEMSNPQLNQEMEELIWDIESHEAALKAEKIKSDTELLNAQYNAFKTQMTLEEASLRYDAYVELNKANQLSLSDLDFQSARLKKAQLEESFRIEKELLAQLKVSLKASTEAKEASLNKLKNQFQRAKDQVDALTVRAISSGVMLEMPLELGQRVNIGDMATKLANQKDLIARLQVPEHKISKVEKGQKVQIDTRTSLIWGEVFRVDPTVVGGNVNVDVRLPLDLPEEARAELSIDGEIFIAEKQNTIFVRRPVYFQENQDMTIYKLDPSGKYAEQVTVKFGMSSSTEIEVLDGLSVSDRIIISEQNNFERFDKIALQ